MNNTLINLRINNRPYLCSTSMTIFQACFEKKVYVPRFCYHVALKIAGNCRMCLVEEKSSLKPVASCAVSVVAGMVIYTQTEMVKKAREGVIEYLLINHPLDCPICDQGGECDLQDQTMVFGADRGRFYEQKRSTPNKNLGFLIKTFLNRCIHCARCTRFLHDVAATEDLALLGRGYKTEISTYVSSFLTSEISGNIADLCPVGALTSKPYAFRARPWELVSVYLFDIAEPFAANIELNYRGLELLRVLPRINYEVNDEWISDKTRFYHDSFNLQRLDSPFIFKNSVYERVSWLCSMVLWKNVLGELLYFDNLRSGIVKASSVYTGDYTDLQTTLSWKILEDFYTAKNVPATSFDFRSQLYATTTTRSYLFSKEEIFPHQIVLISANPRFESPVLNIKLRYLFHEKMVSVAVVGFCANLNYNYTHLSLFWTQKLLLFLGVREENTLFVVGRQSENLPWTAKYQIATNFSALSSGEVRGKGLNNFSFYLTDRIFLGQPESGLIQDFNFIFTSALLHHMEDAYWNKYFTSFLLKLPTKFYLEKAVSYISESGYLFSTLINIFGYSLRGVKEEWKIMLALLESLGNQVFDYSIFFQGLDLEEYGRQDFLKYSESGSFFSTGRQEFSSEAVNHSVINNYYNSSLLSRLSPVLNLCAQTYNVLNDYKFVLKI